MVEINKFKTVQTRKGLTHYTNKNIEEKLIPKYFLEEYNDEAKLEEEGVFAWCFIC